MDELKLTVKEWHLLTIAYHEMVKQDPQTGMTQQNREKLAERIKEFTNRVYEVQKPVVVRFEDQ